jgi:molecular chaperone GrpE
MNADLHAKDDAAEGARDLPEPAGDDLAARLEAALREKEETHRNWQRALADYQNLRRRLATDVEDAVRRGKKALVGDLLLVLDYLDMALQSPASGAEAQALRAGVELTRQQLWTALQREGVSVVPETGAFDPACHECVEQVEAGSGASGRIVATLRRGYALGGVVLRPAQVRVAGGGRAAAAGKAEGAG